MALCPVARRKFSPPLTTFQMGIYCTRRWSDFGSYKQERGMSTEDRRVLELWDKNVSFSDGHYTLLIPFKNPALKLPDNQQMAEKRLSSLKHKLLKNHDLHRKYMDGMNDLLKKDMLCPFPRKMFTEKAAKYGTSHIIL